MSFDDFKNAVIGLFAYDTGCVDSGIHDPQLRAQCIAWLNALTEDQQRKVLSDLVRECFLEPAALEKGYGWEDAGSFCEWLGELG